MESLPREFILHRVPLMAVMGLGTGKDSEPTSPTSPTSSVSRRNSMSTGSSSPVTSRQQISKSLLALLTAKNHHGGGGGIWEAGKGSNATFHVVAVEKNHEFPPRKFSTRSSSSPTAPHLTMPVPHSPLSPLTPGSPLHPDGLISPIWIRKHRENVPAVAVGFYELWDWSSLSTITGGISVGQISERLDEKGGGNGVSSSMHEPSDTSDNTEKERDGQLAAEISERRKTIQDRGIKFAAVVILKQQHIDDPTIEERISFIRKACGLEQKNSFFVLSSTFQGELQNFVINLQKSLYEVALGYYRELGKRIKKKRSKLPPASVGFVPPSSDQLPNMTPQPLGIQGWMIRYDYKMATFAEFRQEIDTAIKYYESAYTLLLDMFAPTSSITPGAPGFPIRTKRWAEAKICKLNLYLDASSAATGQLNRHIAAFQKLSNTWGIGEDTFEYWAWLTKQYRVFGDLLEIATRSGFKINYPVAYSNNSNSTTSDYRYGYGGGRNAWVNPKMVLQHAGFYYRFAATCTSERKKRFQSINKLIRESKDTSKLPPAQILEAEGNIDHSTLTIELLTKSYEQFKKYKSGRMTLHLASEIASTYFESGKYEMALKFFERIAKTYRKEIWHSILESILRLSLKCARDLGAWENVVEYLIELLSDRISQTHEKRVEIQNQLINILYKNEIPNAVSNKPIMIDMNLINSFVTCNFQFKQTATFVGAPTPFQVAINTSSNSPVLPMRFDYLHLSFNNTHFNYHLIDKGESITNNSILNKEKIKWIDCRDDCQQIEVEGFGFVWTKKVNLNITSGSTFVYEGLLVPTESGELTLLTISLGLLTPNWKVELNFNSKSELNDSKVRRKWLEFEQDNDTESNDKIVATKPKFIPLEGSGEQSSIKITHKRAKVEIQVKHHSPALLNEHYPIELTILNLEAEDVKVVLNAELVSIDFEGSYAYLTSDPAEKGKQSLNEIDIGIIPAGQSSIKIIYIYGEKFSITRTLRLSIWYASALGIPTTLPPTQGWIEKDEELRIPFIIPFDASFSLVSQHKGIRQKGDEYVNKESLERLERYLLVSRITSSGPWDIIVSGVDLILPDKLDLNNKLQIRGSSTELEDFHQQKQVWRPGSAYQANYLLELANSDLVSSPVAMNTGSLVITWRRSTKFGDANNIFTKTMFPAPSIEPSTSSVSVTILIPPTPVVGQLFTLTYNVTNFSLSHARIHVYAEVHEAFVFAGYKQTSIRVSPLSTYLFKVNCFPLVVGKVRLPKVRFVIKTDPDATSLPKLRFADPDVPPPSADQELKIFAPGIKENTDDDGIMVFIGPKQNITEELL
ncbi:7467_t:CDS:10 [Ambispora gerdemannii]|uniref:7467_t:CDS:1 n=1 Tax=Ambispora gerdemannii TaxID=144530 RepID=A0A9N8ZJU2_9GLOM|nr:7467_t:CDS:10 [Ambispora gerdemannii]